MSTVKTVPLKAKKPQSFSIQLSGTTYRMTWRWCSPAACWLLDVADASGAALVSGVPAVTGLDILAPFRHLGFVGSLVVQGASDPDAVPTFDDLGAGSHVYYVVH